MRPTAQKPVLLATLIALAACDTDVNLTPVEQALGAAVAVGWVVDYAMASAAGSNVPCVGAGVYCGAPDCSGEISVGNGAECVLPMSETAEGAIGVQASWTSADTGVFGMQFGQVKAGKESLVIFGIAGAAAVRSDQRIYIGYAGENIKAKNGTLPSAYIQQTAWLVDIDTRDTALDPTDDHLLITGGTNGAGIDGDNPVAIGSGEISNVESRQMAFIGVEIDPSCPRNPIGGYAIIDGLSLKDPGITGLRFHRSCDGEVDVIASLGPAIASSGSSIPIRITSP
jgi:hypothetical protein